jgi:hypothetical protein
MFSKRVLPLNATLTASTEIMILKNRGQRYYLFSTEHGGIDL